MATDYAADFDLGEDGYFRNVREVVRRLNEAYEPTNLGNKDDPFEELVYVLLSTRTPEAAYQAAFRRVKEVVGGDWKRLPETGEDALAEAIGSAGLARRKARSLRAAAARVREDAGRVDLSFLRERGTEEADRYLRGLRGVGPKTARCVLLYALDRPVYPIDSHCRRVGHRLGWFDAPSRKMPLGRRRAIEWAVPEELRRDLHVRQIQHGRAVCTTASPDCATCVLSDLCVCAQTE